MLAERWLGSSAGLDDQSRSGYDMSLGAMLKRAGLSYAEMRAALIANTNGAGADHADDDRYFERIWSRTVVEPPPEPPPSPDDPGYWEAVEERATGEGPRPETEGHVPPGSNSGLPIVYFDDLQPNLDTADFVEGLLIEGGMSVIYGESNCGKTFFMTDLAIHVALNRAWRGRDISQGGVIYCALEGSHGISNRVAAFRRRHALDGLDIPFAVIPSAINMLDPAADTPRLIDAINAVAKAKGMKVKMVVIDTLSRAMAGGNENAPDDMGALVTNTDRVRQETGAHVAFVHHSGKDTAPRVRAATACLEPPPIPRS